MLIHDEIIIDIESGKILSDVSYEYDGPVLHCGGGGSAPVYTLPSATEQALDAEQLAMLKEQRTAQAELEPFILESMGLVRNATTGKIEKSSEVSAEDILLKKSLLLSGYDEKGNLLTEDQQLAGMTDVEKLEYQTNKLNLQQQKDALEGKLAISPALEEELKTEEAQAEELLTRKLGKDWQLSTPGQNLMKTIKQKNELVREEARRGLVKSSEAIASSKASQKDLKASNLLSLGSAYASEDSETISNLMGFITSKTTGMDDSLSLSSKYASRSANLQNAASQAAASSSAASSATSTALIGAGGAVVSAAAAAAAF